jgi:hypothetical protein
MLETLLFGQRRVRPGYRLPGGARKKSMLRLKSNYHTVWDTKEHRAEVGDWLRRHLINVASVQ